MQAFFSEKKACILTAGQNIILTEELSENPILSEVSVFGTFVGKFMSLQRHLYDPYHTDDLLRDRLLPAVNIPVIQTTLRDCMSRTSHQVVNRVVNKLSDKVKSAGSM